MRVTIRPEVDDPYLLSLFHEMARERWTSREYAEGEALGFLPEGVRQALATILAPVYLSAQLAVRGGSLALVHWAGEGRGSHMVGVAALVMDEARHVEVLEHVFRWLGWGPRRRRDQIPVFRFHAGCSLRRGVLPWLVGLVLAADAAVALCTALQEAFPAGPVRTLGERIAAAEVRHRALGEHLLRRLLPSLPLVAGGQLRAQAQEMSAQLDEMARTLEPWGRRAGVDLARAAAARAAGQEETLGRAGLPACLLACPRARDAAAPLPEPRCAACWVARLAPAASG